jgi:hypothetical protein
VETKAAEMRLWICVDGLLTQILKIPQKMREIVVEGRTVSQRPTYLVSMEFRTHGQLHQCQTLWFKS